MNLGVALSVKLIKDHRDSSQQEDFALGVRGPELLLEDRASLKASPTFPLTHQRVMQSRAVLADHERATTLRDPEEEAGRAEVAVGDPEVLGRHLLQDLIQQRPLLGMAV